MFPYPPDNGVGRDDGLQNYGGKLLKCDLEQLKEIPEIGNDPVLTDSLKMINSEESPFMSLGCSSSINQVENGYYSANGYIQISFNDKNLIQKPENYFGLFWDFNQFVLEKVNNLPVIFTWQLEHVRYDSFTNPPKTIVYGLTTVIGIETDLLPDEETCRNAWNLSLKVLSDFLSATSVDLEDEIYEC